MEATFIAAIVLGALFLFLPGALIIRALGNTGPGALGWAPALTLGFYGLGAIAYGALGIPCSWATMFLPLALAGAAALLGRRLLERRGFAGPPAVPLGEPSESRASKADWGIFALYAGFGLFIVAVLFLGNIGGLDTYAQEYDNIHHLSLMGQFMETGRWSSLGPSLYMAEGDPAAPLPDWGFYPSAWHGLGAMVGSILGLGPAMAVNAMNYLFTAVVFPAGVYAMMAALFPGNRHLHIFGAFAAYLFASFPWKLLTYGPIYPNLAALCLAPAAVALFVACLQVPLGRWRRVGRIAAGVMALAGIALTQTNVIFTLVVLLYPYCIYRIWKMPPLRGRRLRQIAAVAVFTVLAALIWYGIFMAPFMASIVQFQWKASEGVGQAIGDVLTLHLAGVDPQPLLALLVAAGFVGLLLRPGSRWIPVAYLLMACLFILAITTDRWLKQLLTGFWYTDGFRLSANLALFAIPLAAYGLSLLWHPFRERGFRNGAAAVIAIGVSVLVFWNGLPFFGDGEARTAFGRLRLDERTAYSLESNVYEPDEAAFVAKVKQIVPEGALILNNPNDGSFFAYAADGLNVYYRPPGGYEVREAPKEGREIRFGLDTLTTNDEVRRAVDEVGASYVLQLDYGDAGDKSRRLASYAPWDFVGIDHVDVGTPGFELLLEEGDCRLYKIAETS